MHVEKDAVLPEPPDASVSVGERVNELELVVDDRGLEKRVRPRTPVLHEGEQLLDEARHLGCGRGNVSDARPLHDADAASTEASSVRCEARHEDTVRSTQVLRAGRIKLRDALVRRDGVLHLADFLPVAEDALAIDERRHTGLVESSVLDGEGRLDGADPIASAELWLWNRAGKPFDTSDQAGDLRAGRQKLWRHRERRAVGAAGHDAIVSDDTIGWGSQATTSVPRLRYWPRQLGPGSSSARS